MLREGERWRMVQGDCLDLVPTLKAKDVAAVVTDPPYGKSLHSNGQLFKNSEPILGDDDTYLAQRIHGICAAWRWPLAMFFSPLRWFTNNWRSVLVWAKGDHVGAGGDRRTCWKRDIEMIGIAWNRHLNGERDSALLRVNAISPNFVGTVHPAEKPVPLMRYLVEKLTQPGDVVLDPFAGSGTTGVACLLSGRRFLGIEKDPAYCALAVKRLAETDAEPPLFAQTSLLDPRD